ncbi:hypothetical protein BD309DRAFT_974226 [Dichomitus squalens]|nr:hypothetical protein BD309DRAFT_974226 [Dichomitus squalens]
MLDAASSSHTPRAMPSGSSNPRRLREALLTRIDNFSTRANTTLCSSRLRTDTMARASSSAYVFYGGLIEERDFARYRSAFLEALSDLSRYWMAASALFEGTRASSNTLTASAVAANNFLSSNTPRPSSPNPPLPICHPLRSRPHRPASTTARNIRKPRYLSGPTPSQVLWQLTCIISPVSGRRPRALRNLTLARNAGVKSRRTGTRAGSPSRRTWASCSTISGCRAAIRTARTRNSAGCTTSSRGPAPGT